MISSLFAQNLGVIAIVLFLLIVLFNSIIVVGGREIAVLERRWFGKGMPRGRVIAMANEIGVQARTLGPGMHLLIPFLYKARKMQFTVIGEQEVGLIESIDGNSIPAGKIFAKVAPNHNSFQDAEAFLKNGGEKGPQIEILPPGTYRINPALFKVRNVGAVVIDSGQIGVVTAMDGGPITTGRLLGIKVDGHSNFEDGEKFLANGGQKGPQSEILLPGTYRINRDLFHVQIADATIVPAGKVGLVTALDGEPLPETEYVAKSVPDHKDFQNVSK
ncbi:MAG TPA: hypothetical protein VIH57_01760, partial [Bacteroidales bacterium]